MAIGVISQKLRPLKIAFLVEPNSSTALLRAIQSNTFLWGGQFNPIIPVFLKTPEFWQDRFTRNLHAKEVIEGTLDAYDPDLVTAVGNVSLNHLDLGHRQIIEFSEFEKSIIEYGIPTYGISLYDVLEHFLNKEFKFHRRFPIPILVPIIGRMFRTFLSALYGSFHAELDEHFRSVWKKDLDFEEPERFGTDYLKHLASEILFPIRMTTLYLSWHNEGETIRRNRIFLLDAANYFDIIDYWNLRALGWSILPVPVQFMEDKEFMKAVASLIEEYYRNAVGQNRLDAATVILKSRSLSEEMFKTFRRSLPLSKPDDPNKKTVPKSHFPRLWDEWARPRDQIGFCSIRHKSKEKEVTDLSQNIRYSPLEPDFQVEKLDHIKAQFANEVELRAYGGDQLYAGFLPEAHPHVLFSIGATPFDNWRISKRGAVNLCRPYETGEYLRFPLAEEVMQRWFDSHGWKIELSPPGRLAKQMLKQLGGIWGIEQIANKQVIELIKDMTSGSIKLPLRRQIFNLIKAKTSSAETLENDDIWKIVDWIQEKLVKANSGIEKSMSRQEFWRRIRKAADEQPIPFPPQYLLESLISAGIFKLGYDIQCPLCQQHSWYSLTELDYNLTCKKCTGNYTVPTHSVKEIKPHYTASGPFALPNRAHGAPIVLLCLRFFSKVMHSTICPILSFEEKDKTLEIDLALHLETRAFGEVQRDLLLFECKTENLFTSKDRDKMEYLARLFEGAVLVFATLRDELTEKEKKLLRPLVNKGRKYWKAERPYNPVLILTGNELFGHLSVTKSWEKLSQRHQQASKWHSIDLKLMELCDATQQLYLDMESWHDWLEVKWERRRRKIKSRQSGKK